MERRCSRVVPAADTGDEINLGNAEVDFQHPMSTLLALLRGLPSNGRGTLPRMAPMSPSIATRKLTDIPPVSSRGILGPSSLPSSSNRCCPLQPTFPVFVAMPSRYRPLSSSYSVSISGSKCKHCTGKVGT